MTQGTGSLLTDAITTFSLLTLRTSSISFRSSLCTAWASIRLRESADGGVRWPLGKEQEKGTELNHRYI